MCSVFSILGAIFALFLNSVQAKHMWIRVYPFASGDCNGPPILGNVDVPKDTCKIVPFGGSSIKLMELTLGDWTREINKGATGCYFYAYTQYGCLERYLDIIVDPGDVMNLCVPSRDANDPILAVSFTCIYGEPPRRRWALAAAANRTANALNMTSPEVASAYLRGRAVIDKLRKSNGTTRFNNSIASGAAQNVSVRSVNHHGPAFINGERNVNLTYKANDSNSVSARSVNFHGPAFINGKPNFNSSRKLSKRESDDEPSIVSGILDSNSTHELSNSKSENPVESISARSVNRHGPASLHELPGFNSSREYKDSESDDYVQLGNNTTGHHELADANRIPFTNGTNGQVHSVGTPTVANANKDSEGSEGSENDSGDSDDDSDWSDDDSDDNGDEYESYGNSTSFGNSTSLGKRNVWWMGPRIGVWMLHPWTGGLLCYTCYSKSNKELSRFECRWGYKHHGDCGEKPLAPIYTKTVTIQPVVTVTPLPERPSIQKRSWHLPVYLQNPWYPGITVCSIAEWEGKGKRWNQEIRIEQMHKKLYKCNKSPIAQNIAVWVRTATSIAPVKTVSILDQKYDSVSPPPVTMISTIQDGAYNFVKATVTSFEPIPVPTSSAAASESTTSAAPSESTTSATTSESTASAAVSVSTISVGTVYPTIDPTPATRLPVFSYVEPPDVKQLSIIGVSRRSDATELVPEPTAQPAMSAVDLSPYAGIFTSVVVEHVSGAPEPESAPTAQPRSQNMYVDPRAGGFSTVIVSRISDTP